MERSRPDPQRAPVWTDQQRGKHGEDVKEYDFYVDSTPTHSYMKYLYKYPQAEYPYLDLVQTNARRSTRTPARAANTVVPQYVVVG